MSKLPRVVLLLSTVLLGCPKRVMVNGQEMSVSDADAQARGELARVLASAGAEPPEVTAGRLEAMAARFGEVPASADALYEAGVRWRAAKRPDRAQAVLGQLLTQFPLAPRSDAAKYQLALAEGEAGRPKDALASLASLYGRLPASERPQAARDAASAAEAAHAWAAAAHWRAEAARLAAGEDRERELARALEHLETRLAFPEVQGNAEVSWTGGAAVRSGPL